MLAVVTSALPALASAVAGVVVARLLLPLLNGCRRCTYVLVILLLHFLWLFLRLFLRLRLRDETWQPRVLDLDYAMVPSTWYHLAVSFLSKVRAVPLLRHVSRRLV